MAGALGAVLSLYARDRTGDGTGQAVDVALYDAMVAVSDMPPFLWSMGLPPEFAAAGRIAICSASFAERL